MEVPDSIRAQLAPYLENWSRRATDFRWVPAANLHLTLKFLGNSEESRLQELASSLRGLPFPPFELAFGSTGSFGTSRRARVVWLELARGASEVVALASTVEQAASMLGWEPEMRSFRPHLTLARARDRRGSTPPAVESLPELGSWTAQEVTIYQSRLRPGAPEYLPLHTIPLAGSLN